MFIHILMLIYLQILLIVTLVMVVMTMLLALMVMVLTLVLAMTDLQEMDLIVQIIARTIHAEMIKYVIPCRIRFNVHVTILMNSLLTEAVP